MPKPTSPLNHSNNTTRCKYAPNQVARKSGVDDRRVPELIGGRHVARNAKLLEDDWLVLSLLGSGVVLNPADTPLGGVSRLSPAQLHMSCMLVNPVVW